MSKKRSQSRLGANMPVARGLSTLFGGGVAEKPMTLASDITQGTTETTETSDVIKTPETPETKEILNTKVTPPISETSVTPDVTGITQTPATTKVEQKKKIKKSPAAPVTTVAADGAEFTPTRGLPAGWERHTYVVQTKHVNMIESAAYWDRVDKKDVLRAALDMFFKGRKLKPLPPEKRRERKPRAGAKK